MTITHLHPADNPGKAFFAGRDEHVKPLGEYDEDGQEILGLSPEMAVLIFMERISDELSARDRFPKGRIWWQTLKNLARQRGIPDLHIKQLEQALSAAELNQLAIIRALNRWTPRLPAIDMVGIFQGG
ncbi:MAG: hypothetical protein RLZZ09_1825 [Pseudomonadota bacterium]|jgi:hypothetical protein